MLQANYYKYSFSVSKLYSNSGAMATTFRSSYKIKSTSIEEQEISRCSIAPGFMYTPADMLKHISVLGIKIRFY